MFSSCSLIMRIVFFWCSWRIKIYWETWLCIVSPIYIIAPLYCIVQIYNEITLCRSNWVLQFRTMHLFSGIGRSNVKKHYQFKMELQNNIELFGIFRRYNHDLARLKRGGERHNKKKIVRWAVSMSIYESVSYDISSSTI